MPITYDVSTDAGKVRLLISDTVDANHIFEDDEIDAFLSMQGGVVLRAAAQALDTIAGNEVQVLKVIRNLDTTTDGAKVADSLRALAASYRKQADEGTTGGGEFEIAEIVNDDFSLRTRIENEALREF